MKNAKLLEPTTGVEQGGATKSTPLSPLRPPQRRVAPAASSPSGSHYNTGLVSQHPRSAPRFAHQTAATRRVLPQAQPPPLSLRRLLYAVVSCTWPPARLPCPAPRPRPSPFSFSSPPPRRRLLCPCQGPRPPPLPSLAPPPQRPPPAAAAGPAPGPAGAAPRCQPARKPQCKQIVMQ